jgi:hypothetical protein
VSRFRADCYRLSGDCRDADLRRRSRPAVGARHPYRGAGLDVVWQPFVILFVIGAMLFRYALARFRGTIGMMV